MSPNLKITVLDPPGVNQGNTVPHSWQLSWPERENVHPQGEWIMPFPWLRSDPVFSDFKVCLFGILRNVSGMAGYSAGSNIIVYDF